MHSDLWSHALAVYARPGVEQACLALQEQGADVCLLLCATWLQARGTTPEPERLEALRQVAGQWQREVVMPLRQLRQRWREPAAQDAEWAGLREQVKRLELEAEKTLLQRLEYCARSWPVACEGAGADWLERLAPPQASGGDALNQLRRAAVAAQEDDEVD